MGGGTAQANLKDQKRYARFVGSRPSKRKVVALLMPHRLSQVPTSADVGQQTARLMQLRVQLGRTSQARASVGDVMVLSMLTNISMAVLFVVPGWLSHMKVTSSEHTR